MHRSTYRVLQILLSLANTPSGLSLTQLAQSLDIPKGSLHPILKTMLAENFIRLNETSNYCIGQNAYYVGTTYTKQSDLLQEIDIVVKELSNSLKQTIFFSVLSAGDCFYLLKQSVQSPIQITAKQGFYLPAYSTAIGKSLLSGLNQEELSALYPNGLRKLTEHTIDNFSELEHQLELIRQTGFSYEKEESTKDVQCIARPVKYNQKVIAGISAAIPVFYYSSDLEEKIKKELLSAGNKIEMLIYRNPEEWIYSPLY